MVSYEFQWWPSKEVGKFSPSKISINLDKINKIDCLKHAGNQTNAHNTVKTRCAQNLLCSCLGLSLVLSLLRLYGGRIGVKDQRLVCQVEGGSLDLRGQEIPTLMLVCLFVCLFVCFKKWWPLRWPARTANGSTGLRLQSSLAMVATPHTVPRKPSWIEVSDTTCQIIGWLQSCANTGQFLGLTIKKVKQ